jgi:hypothetical protein
VRLRENVQQQRAGRIAIDAAEIADVDRCAFRTDALDDVKQVRNGSRKLINFGDNDLVTLSNPIEHCLKLRLPLRLALLAA